MKGAATLDYAGHIITPIVCHAICLSAHRPTSRRPSQSRKAECRRWRPYPDFSYRGWVAIL